MARTEVSGSQIKDGSVALSGAASPTGNADVAGVLPAGNGGTGLSSPGASGNVLTSDGTGWTTAAPTGGGGAVGFTSTAGANGTTSLTSSSTQIQVITGSFGQTLRLPSTGIVAGAQYQILNASTLSNVPVQTSTGVAITTLSPNTSAVFTAILSPFTAAANWVFDYPVNLASAQVLTNKTISGASNTISGLTVPQGGTGVSTLAANGVVLGNGNSGVTTVAPGTSTNVLTSNGTTWVSGTVRAPADFILVASGDSIVRAAGGGDFTTGFYVGRAFTLTKIIYQFGSPDASGSTVVAVRLNGTAITSSTLTITAVNQADGTATDAARTATVNQSVAVGDRLIIWTTSVGTTPGAGLRAYLFGAWN